MAEKEMMKAVVVTEPGKVEIKETEVPEPSGNEVRIDVRASGICHSDEICIEGSRPGTEYPRIPGHEVAGVVDEVGEEVERLEEGDRVGVGWHGGHCFECEECRRGNFMQCKEQQVTGLDRDGGHAEYMTARAEAVAEIPEGMSFTEAAPIMCAGVTTYNAMRNTDARPGDTVAVVGIGGLGHLGIQYVSKGGFETVAISHSPEKENYARDLGADHFIDSGSEDVAERLKDLGGAKAVLATAPVKESMEQVISGLGTDGNLVALGVPEEDLEIPVVPLLDSRGCVSGFSTGHARDSQDTLEFSKLKDIEPETEIFDLEDYQKAYQKMMDGDVRFRAVLEV